MRDMKRTCAKLSAFAAAVLLLSMTLGAAAYGHTEGRSDAGSSPARTWIIGWQSAADPQLNDYSRVLFSDPALRITLAAPLPGDDPAHWLSRVERAAGVRFIEPNRQVAIAAPPRTEAQPLEEAQPGEQTLPEGQQARSKGEVRLQATPAPQASASPAPYIAKQKFLDQIHMKDAWKYATGQKAITVAVVDTGVDLNHPGLKASLVPGINLVNPRIPPQDDNGHGTNVAGIIVAVANNPAETASKVRIMPIKAIEADGKGDEETLGEGIRYAVDHGARIIVLSLGMNRSSAYMQEIVQYAEDHGVLMVSASGNENNSVKYPAAYPTVLAVGGINSDNTAVQLSNYGPELDVVAPWTVYSTALGGDYMYNEGTSMAAPQAAGVAALLWEKYPQMKPFEIRNMLRQSAQDVEGKGWDPYTGYGLLRADRALSMKYATDFYENNNMIDAAKLFPVDSMIYGDFNGPGDQDWFILDAPYDGSIAITFDSANENSADIGAVFYSDKTQKGVVYTDILNRTITIPVTQGRHYIVFNVADQKLQHLLVYKATSHFHIYRDPFEDNDRQYKAFQLPTRSQTIKGTFDHDNDQDWYALNIQQSGTLALSVSSDTARMDLSIAMQRQDQKAVVADYNSDGEPESLPRDTPYLNVTPGIYYILVENEIYDEPPSLPVTGEYTLKIDYNTKYIDPNEPNDKFYQAVTLSPGTDYRGVIDQARDIDWFSFTSDGKDGSKLVLDQIPQNRIMSITLFDENQKQLAINLNALGEEQVGLNRLLPKGTYYVRVSSDLSFDSQMYRLRLTEVPLVAGFKDIAGHWAENSIVAFSKKHVISGYSDFSFRPDAPITRAEATSVVVRALELTRQQQVKFTDVSASYWGYPYIAKATAAGFVSGYGDGTFAPDRNMTRMEMAVMIARAMNLNGIAPAGQVFTDVGKQAWGADLLNQMAERQWIAGFPNGTFQPDRAATRAEFVSILDHVIDK